MFYVKNTSSRLDELIKKYKKQNMYIYIESEFVAYKRTLMLGNKTGLTLLQVL